MEEEDAHIAVFLSQIAESRKRSLVEASSSSSPIETDSVETMPPVARASSSRSPKPHEDLQEIIDIDMVEDSDNMMVINNQGQEALATLLLNPSAANLGSMDGVKLSKSFSEGSQNLSYQDGFTSDLSVDDDEHIDIYSDDVAYHDNYSLLQHHFDNADIPPGVEAPIPWLLDPGQINKNLPAASGSSPSSSSHTHTDMLCLSPEDETSLSWWKQETDNVMNNFTPMSGESQKGAPIQTHGLYVEPPQRKKKLNNTSNAKSLLGEKPLKSQLFPESSRGEKKPNAPIISSPYFLHKQMDAEMFPTKLEPPPRGTYISSSSHLPGIASITSPSSNMQMAAPNFPPGTDTSSAFYLPKFKESHYQVLEKSSGFLSPHTSSPFPSGLDTSAPQFNSSKFKNSPNQIFENFSFFNPHTSIPFPLEEEADISWIKIEGMGSIEKDGTTTGSSTIPSDRGEDIFKHFEHFKLFDTVHDHADHHYTNEGFPVAQAPKIWAKKIQEEWRILEKDLPDTIFVRVYESRLDLLRAVIIGAEGTPYHNGLFVFDFFFPPGYPNVPPSVYYHSGGLRLNPNLYGSGKVCLSLLNTWSGDKNEKWIPGLSTMLQVLVSIQGLILNAKPFFNEPGFACMNGSAKGERESHQYNERTFILSLKTMLYTMRRPPKHFESFVVGHFRKHAQDILASCNAYMDGAEVGCLVKHGGSDVERWDTSCSEELKESLAGYVKLLVKAFTQIGVQDCEKFLSC